MWEANLNAAVTISGGFFPSVIIDAENKSLSFKDLVFYLGFCSQRRQILAGKIIGPTVFMQYWR